MGQEQICTIQSDTSQILYTINKYVIAYHAKNNIVISFPEDRKLEAVGSIIEISKIFSKSPKDVLSKKRTEELFQVRIIISLELMRLGYNKSQIGVALSRNHASILNCLKKHVLFWSTNDKQYQYYLVRYKEYLMIKNIKRVMIQDRPSRKILYSFT